MLCKALTHTVYTSQQPLREADGKQGKGDPSARWLFQHAELSGPAPGLGSQVNLGLLTLLSKGTAIVSF